MNFWELSNQLNQRNLEINFWELFSEIDRYLHKKSPSFDVHDIATNITCLRQTNSTSADSCSCRSLLTILLPTNADCDEHCTIISVFVPSGIPSFIILHISYHRHWLDFSSGSAWVKTCLILLRCYSSFSTLCNIFKQQYQYSAPNCFAQVKHACTYMQKNKSNMFYTDI